MSLPELQFGERRFPIERYRNYRVSPDRRKMAVFFRDPDEWIGIEGADDVTSALLEIQQAMDPEEGREWR